MNFSLVFDYLLAPFFPLLHSEVPYAKYLLDSSSCKKKKEIHIHTYPHIYIYTYVYSYTYTHIHIPNPPVLLKTVYHACKTKVTDTA